jgi:hypothetical protein
MTLTDIDQIEPLFPKGWMSSSQLSRQSKCATSASRPELMVYAVVSLKTRYEKQGN